MSGSLNRVTLIGNLGQDPEIRNMQSGDRVANLSLATSESWKTASGEKQERVQWHRIVVFNQSLVGVIEKYLKKGMKVLIEGQLESRSWEKDGVKQYMTEVVLRPFNSKLLMLSGRGDAPPPAAGPDDYGTTSIAAAPPLRDDFEDEIPF